MDTALGMDRSGPRYPRVAGLPVLGSALEFNRAPFAFLLRCQQRHGPIFQLNLLLQRPLMLVGKDANIFWRTNERSHMVARPAFERMGKVLGSRRFIMSMDGLDHTRLREIFGQGMTPERLQHFMPGFIRQTRTHLEDWAGAGFRDANHGFKRLVYRQLGRALSPLPADEEYEDVVRVFDTALKIGILRVWPEFFALDPRNVRAHRRVRALCERLVARPAAREEDRTFVDYVIEARARGLLEDGDLLASLMAPFFAGIDTVSSTMASTVYALFREPGLLARVRDEVDPLGEQEFASPRVQRRLKVTRALVQEASRVYTVAVLSVRESTRPLQFAGHVIPAGTALGFCPGLTHHDAIHFQDPGRFDVDRWLTGTRPETGTFQPYGVGPHQCLGAALADAQLLGTIATIARDFDLVFEDPHYVMRRHNDPLPAPKNMQVRFQRRAR